jgi:protein-tyrosine-phosphatase
VADDDRHGASPGNHLQSRMTRVKRYNVLLICPDNAVHSIMAEALLKRWGGADFCAFSAGIKPRGAIDPRTLELLKERRVWHPSIRGKGHREFLGPDAPRMDFVISLGERPPDGAPKRWPGNPQVIHWHITSPDSAGKPDEAAHAFRRAFAELETRIKLFVLVYEKERRKRIAA